MPDVTNRHREPNGRFADENRNDTLFNKQNVNTRAKLKAMCTSIEQGEYDNEIHADLENLGVDTSNGIFATESGWQAIRNYYSGRVEGYASYGSIEDFEHGADDRFTAKEVTQLAEMNAVTPVKSLVGGQERTELQVNKTFSDRYIKDAVPYNPNGAVWLMIGLSAQVCVKVFRLSRMRKTTHTLQPTARSLTRATWRLPLLMPTTRISTITPCGIVQFSSKTIGSTSTRISL